ncbi:MAG: TaqI-like C-terminal specificity domain-containing protein [Thermodesulfobacteriota bacterium]
MDALEHKRLIEESLKAFGSGPLKQAALNLLDVLSYRSERRLDLQPNTGANFLNTFAENLPFDPEKALVADWESVDLLFQLTDTEIRGDGQGRLFDSRGKFNDAIMESYLFVCIGLRRERYTRTQLSAVTRSVNRLFSMPVMLVFKHGDTITLSIIRRRLHRREESKDVLEKVTLIKDIRFADPIRAHIEILHDLSLQALYEEYGYQNFVALHKAWEKRLDTYQLNERFYRDVANWYFWALKHPLIVYPRSIAEIPDESERERQQSIFLIRLLTRLIFCWFLQEKGLLPRVLFRRRFVEQMLKDFGQNSGTFYRAFLQNLFFATLNQEQEARRFRRYNEAGRNGNRGVTNLYRYRDLLQDPDAFLETLKEVPFVNGGLFDCLDDVFKNSEGRPNVRLDDFSEERANNLCVPNELFFGEDRKVDLSEIYDDKRRGREPVRGLIETLGRYKFTVEENTPLEQEIALDPELLGKVFENLLASYNEDTRTTARKATGSFYTPREIVNYMVDEALIAYLKTAMEKSSPQPSDLEERLHKLFSSGMEETPNPFSPEETERLIEAMDGVKILDPACGSGAFPMGALHRMVGILQTLDPNNRHWKEQQLSKARRDRELAEQMEDDDNRANALREIDSRIADIERSFDTRFHALDYARKLYLIENCLYGVDIQPIACQIAKLRFFIALIVDQNVDSNAKNRGVRPLPNLETKIVAADTLMPAEKPSQHQGTLTDFRVRGLREQLERVRHDHFNARSPERKERCRARDETLRGEIAGVLEEGGWPPAASQALAAWDPYDQNHAAGFFDPEWMFGIPVGKVQVAQGVPSTFRGHFVFMNQARGQMELTQTPEVESGFDIVIGNPPYVRQEQIKDLKPRLKEHYDCFTGTADLYVYFYERSIKLLRPGGIFSLITSNKWYRSAYGERLREWLAKSTRVLHLVDFGDAPVFTAISYPTIVILQRLGETEVASESHELHVCNWKPGPDLEFFAKVVRQNAIPLRQSSLKAEGWRLESPAVLELVEKLRRAGKPLGEYVNGRFYYGIKTGLNEAFVVDRSTRDRLIAEHKSSATVLKPFLRGRDVKRWRVDIAEQYLIRIESSENKQHPWSGKTLREAEKAFANAFPAIHARFKRLRGALVQRDDQGRYFWELRSCAYWKEFEQPKIVIPAIARTVAYAPDSGGHYSNDKTTICVTEQINYLLALMNSRVLWWFIRRTAATKQGGFYEFKPMYVGQLPIPKAEHGDRKRLESLVERILTAKQGDAGAHVSDLEREIDERVYGLYGLTEDEIAVVEDTR